MQELPHDPSAETEVFEYEPPECEVFDLTSSWTRLIHYAETSMGLVLVLSWPSSNSTKCETIYDGKLWARFYRITVQTTEDAEKIVMRFLADIAEKKRNGPGENDDDYKEYRVAAWVAGHAAMGYDKWLEQAEQQK